MPISQTLVSPFTYLNSTTVQLVFNLFSQFITQLELYSQLQLNLWIDPITLSVPKNNIVSAIKDPRCLKPS